MWFARGDWERHARNPGSWSALVFLSLPNQDKMARAALRQRRGRCFGQEPLRFASTPYFPIKISVAIFPRTHVATPDFSLLTFQAW